MFITMLVSILGNKTAEKVMLHLFHYNESHASAISNDLSIPLTPVVAQLKRFEEGGILISKQVGRSRVYSFNQKSNYYKPLQDLVRIAYESIPLSERQKLFKKSRKPRKSSKILKMLF
jgi:predicted transcriptional regulator